MFRSGVLTTRGRHLLLGVAMWLGAAPSTLLTIAGDGGTVSARYPVSLVMMIAMILCAREILRGRQAA